MADGKDITAAAQSTALYRRTEIIENYAAPRCETEEKVIAIFQQILGIDKIGIKEDFFALGGDSLKALRVISEIHKVFNVKIQVSDIFNNQTAELLVSRFHAS